MAIDIFPVWADPNGTPDILAFPYVEGEREKIRESFFEDMNKLNLNDQVISLRESDVRKLRLKWSHDAEISTKIDQWLTRCQGGFIRLIINY